MATEVLQRSAFEIEVKKLIDNQLNTYEDHNRIISDYRAEKQIAESYNGRQLLELLQNADDAGTKEVLIDLDLENEVLRIANNGNPFDIKGVQSLMLAYNSPKNKKEFIGNKGLGFRSVLNWTTEIKIRTRECILEFSPERAKVNFEELVPNHSERRRLIEGEEELREEEVPFGVLSIPHLSKNYTEQEWETIIDLRYDQSSKKAIQDQIEDLKPETLLFLKRTRKITIRVTGESEQVLKRKNLPSSETDLERIELNGVEYNIYSSSEKPLPDGKKKFYSYKIAWQDDLCDEDSTFFTFFPTQVYSHLPFLIHGTFDLDPTRNHFNKSEDNDFILNEIAEKIGEIAIKYLKKEGASDWISYGFLSVTGRSENKHLEGFFQKIENLRSTLQVYPCVDTTYVSRETAVYHGDDFSKWIIRNEVGDFFPCLIIPNTEELDINLSYDHKYSVARLAEIFEKLTFSIPSINERALLLRILTGPQFYFIKNSELSMPLLLNSKDEPVLDQSQVFLEEDKDYEIPPDLIPISFLSRGLYRELLDVFKEELEELRVENENLSRPLKRHIGKVVNVGAKDINEVIRFMVSEINSKIETEPTHEKKVRIVVEFHKILFSIFKTNTERKGTLNLKVPILNRLEKVTTANRLFLGKNFSSGVIMEKIFEGFYTYKDFVCEFSTLELPVAYELIFEDYLLWIGVVKFTRLEKVEEKLWKYEDGYTQFVFEHVGRPQNVTTVEYSGLKIENFDKIICSPSFSPEKLIAWIVLDPQLENALEFTSESTSFKHSYYNTERKLPLNPSYIFYQFSSFLGRSKQFYLSDLDYAPELGFDVFDLNHSLFLELGKKEEDVRSILNKLKIKSRFRDLPIEQAYEVLSLLPQKDVEKKYGRRLYQYFYKTYRNIIPQDIGDLILPSKLLATKEGEKRYVESEKIFYTDNATLPKIITDKIWMFDYPKRTGEQKVSQLFGVRTLKDIDVTIDFKSILIHLSDREFQKWYSLIKPYLLTYRLLTVSGKELRSEAVKSLQVVSVQIVSELKYKFQDEEWHDLQHGEFMVDKDSNYFICCNRSFALEEAKEDPAFAEAFAEVLTTIFKVNDHKEDYRLIFQDKSLNQTKFLITRNELEEDLEEARNLLGLNSLEVKFWKNVFKVRGMSFPEEIVTTENLKDQLEKNFNFQLPHGYGKVDLLEGSNQETYEFLKEVCDFFQCDLEKILPQDSAGLCSYYKRKFEHVIKDHKAEFNKAIWDQLDVQKKQQTNLISFQTTYDSLAENPDVERSLDENKHNFSLELSDILYQFVERNFGLKMKKGEVLSMEVIESYWEVMKDYGVDPDSIEDENVRSLLYFKGNEDAIKTYLERLSIDKTEDLKPAGKDKKVGKILAGKVQKAKFRKGKGKKQNHVHSNSKAKRKQIIGKNAEELVFNTLEAEDDVENVQWVSGSSKTVSDRSDAKHYDIEYKRKGEQEWKFLEVKSYNGSYFHLTWAEKETAIKYKENYEIALVSGTDIYILKDLFKENFDSNDLFEAVPSEYIISLKVTPSKEE